MVAATIYTVGGPENIWPVLKTRQAVIASATICGSPSQTPFVRTLERRAYSSR